MYIIARCSDKYADGCPLWLVFKDGERVSFHHETEQEAIEDMVRIEAEEE